MKIGIIGSGDVGKALGAGFDFSSGPPPKLSVGHTDSAGERVQRWLPARVVKASTYFATGSGNHVFKLLRK